jgi:hypothetical protein
MNVDVTTSTTSVESFLWNRLWPVRSFHEAQQIEVKELYLLKRGGKRGNYAISREMTPFFSSPNQAREL